MGLSRRRFLQRTGGALAALEASDLLLSLFTTRYQQALAQPTNRKLALLVGINQYSNAPLSGCVTDVELQRELLIHRFGFQPADVLTLIDQQATREQIEAAFVEHLVKQATPGDVVIFHFSGYGRNIHRDLASELTQPALVTAESLTGQSRQNDGDALLQDTLCLLAHSLRTDKVTTVLDTSYTYTGTPLQGNLRGRAYPSTTAGQPSAAELQFQQLLRQQGQKLPVLGSTQPCLASIPGVVLMATAMDQMATESYWNGFTAGLFTYALTQQLWQSSPPIRLRTILRQASERVSDVLHQAQTPHLIGQKQQEAMLPPYFVRPVPSMGVAGVITSVETEGSSVQLWLGGVASPVLEQLAPPSILTIVPTDQSATDSIIRLRLMERTGLTARAVPLESSDLGTNGKIQTGQWVQEHIRVVPRSIGLTLALDADLGRIERVDAISALSVLPWVTPTIAGEQSADYLLSKVQPNTAVQIAALPDAPISDLGNSTVPMAGGYGLFSQARAMIPSTNGESGEAIKGAVKRLQPKLQTLLSIKYLNLAVNSAASGLPVRVSLERVDDKGTQILQQQQSLSAPSNPTKREVPGSQAGILRLPAGSRLHYRVENLSQQTLYTLLFQLNTNGDLVAIYAPPGQTTDSDTPAAAIAPNGTKILPPPTSSFEWIVRRPEGIAEAFILCSNTPFPQTWGLLALGLNTSGQAIVMGKPTNPLEISQAIFQDLSQASKNQPALMEDLSTELVSLNCDTWAGFHFAYQVIA